MLSNKMLSTLTRRVRPMAQAPQRRCFVNSFLDPSCPKAIREIEQKLQETRERTRTQEQIVGGPYRHRGWPRFTAALDHEVRKKILFSKFV